MNKKTLFIVLALGALLLLAGGGWYYISKNKRLKNIVPPLEKKEAPALGGELYNQTANPGSQLPQVNPFQEAKTNPFEEAKTNPFEDIYKNPFSK